MGDGAIAAQDLLTVVLAALGERGVATKSDLRELGGRVILVEGLMGTLQAQVAGLQRELVDTRTDMLGLVRDEVCRFLAETSSMASVIQRRPDRVPFQPE